MLGLPIVQRGYTYIGLMIFLAILALASGTTITVGSLMQQRDNEAELIFIGGQYAAAFRSFFDATPAGQKPFPAKLEELVRDPRYPGIRRHLRKVYVDPITGKEEWGLVEAPGGGIMGVHSLSQKAPIKVAGFDPLFAPLSDKTKYSQWVFGVAAPGIAAPAGTVTLPKPKPEAPAAPAARAPGTPAAVAPAPAPAAPPGRAISAATPVPEQPRTPEKAVPEPPNPVPLEITAPAEALFNEVITVQVGVPAGTAARSVQIALNFDAQTLELSSEGSAQDDAVTPRPRPRLGRATVSLQSTGEGQPLGPASMRFRIVSAARPATQITVSATALDFGGKALSVLPAPPHSVAIVPR